MIKGREWLRKQVRAFRGTDRDAEVMRGKVVAYSPNPQVLIEMEDGTRDWWSADLIEEVGEHITTHHVEDQRVSVFRPGSAAFIASRKPESLHGNMTTPEPPY